jgi:GT2 family glycosyltransferase
VIVVDNSNSDKDYFALQEALQGLDVQIVNPKQNLGTTGGNNFGSSFAKGDFLFFLNSDTILENNSVYSLFSLIKSNKNIAVVGGNLLDVNHNPAHSMIKKEFNLKVVRKQESLLGLILSRVFHRKEFDYSTKPSRIDGYICGADLMIRTDSFNKIGGFDTHIFMYGEEPLLCFKCRMILGQEVWSQPNSRIIHLEGASDQKEISSFKINNMVNGTFFYFDTAYGRKESIKYLRVMERGNNLRYFIGKLMHYPHVENYKRLAQAYKKKRISLKNV